MLPVFCTILSGMEREPHGVSSGTARMATAVQNTRGVARGAEGVFKKARGVKPAHKRAVTMSIRKTSRRVTDRKKKTENDRAGGCKRVRTPPPRWQRTRQSVHLITARHRSRRHRRAAE